MSAEADEGTVTGVIMEDCFNVLATLVLEIRYALAN